MVRWSCLFNGPPLFLWLSSPINVGFSPVLDSSMSMVRGEIREEAGGSAGLRTFKRSGFPLYQCAVTMSETRAGEEHMLKT